MNETRKASDEPITILTRRPETFREYIRRQARLARMRLRGLARPSSPGGQSVDTHGPGVRIRNLARAIDRTDQRYRIDPPAWRVSRLVHAIRGGKASLEWAFEQKRKGRIDVVIAGPTTVSYPDENDGIVKRPELDAYLVASNWNVAMFERDAPELKGRLFIQWSSCDTDLWKPDREPSERDVDFLVYDKTGPEVWKLHPGRDEQEERVREKVFEVMRARGHTFETIKYGQYTPDEYLRSLRRSKAMVFLTRHEGFANAAVEAWACEAPTLIWSRGFWTLDGRRFDGALPADQMTEAAGIRFRDENDFAEALTAFEKRVAAGDFSPRALVLERFSFAAAGRWYVDIWKRVLEFKRKDAR